MQRCPLCLHTGSTLALQDKKRCYFHCPTCHVLFADNASYLPPAVKKQRYDRQRTNAKQQRLNQFVLALISQLEEQENRPFHGLNFGRTVDEATLHQIELAGHTVTNYDPNFAPELQTLRQPYDFVCSYQVIEHFNSPQKEWSILSRLVKPNGWLAISARVLADKAHFSKWHHKNNPTHVCFYQQSTFAYLADLFGFELLFATDEFILMKKNSKSDITRDLIST